MSKTDSLPDFDSLPQSIQAALHSIPNASGLTVALSGGLDSVLLFVCVLSYLNKHADGVTNSLSAIHVNHGLSPNAEQWMLFCKHLCEKYDVRFIGESVNVVETGRGIEQAAREARYGVFERYIGSGDILLQGHHLSDQAETILFRAFRGLGPQALIGIPRERKLKKGRVFRPFVHVSKDELEFLAQELGLKWVDDESNKDARFDRNYIRHAVLPVIKERWPKVLDGLSVSASKIAQLVQRESLWLQFELDKIRGVDEFGCAFIDLAGLNDFPVLLQRSLLRYWLDRIGCMQPSDKIYNRIWTEVIPAVGKGQPEIAWGTHRLVRYKERLYFLPVLPIDKAYEHVVSLDQLDRARQLQCGQYEVVVSRERPDTEGDLWTSYSLGIPAGAGEIKVASRVGGERFQEYRAKSPKSLKECFQDWKVPAWLRHVPLVFVDGELAFVGVGRAAEKFLPVGGESVTISLKPLA